MQRQDKGLLVVSFGTTHEETRRKAIEPIEEALGNAFPERRLYRGWTSRMITGRLRQRGVTIDTLEEALERMQEDGVTDILVQPTHIMEGAENDRMLTALQEASGAFEQVRCGLPLLASGEDLLALADILAEEFLKEAPGAALVLMGHGSAKKQSANHIYGEMQEAFRQLGHENVFVGTVEGEPSFDDVRQQLAGMRPAPDPVILAPMMIVAGDHAKNDMAGDSGDSWKSLLEAGGFRVGAAVRGLGEYPRVREMLVRHAEKAAFPNGAKF